MMNFGSTVTPISDAQRAEWRDGWERWMAEIRSRAPGVSAEEMEAEVLAEIAEARRLRRTRSMGRG